MYERYSGRIVNYIEDNETCELRGDTIIVKEKGKCYSFGVVLIILFGMATLGLVFSYK